MYERFTDRARKVLQLANQEAQRFNHEYIGTEHILLGIVKLAIHREGEGAAATVLKNLGIDLSKIREEVEKIVQSGPDMIMFGKLPQTPRAKRVIEYAIEEARNLNHQFVGTEHLLLGLFREEEGVAAQVLKNFGLTLDRTRVEVLKVLGQPVVDRPEAIQAQSTAIVDTGRHVPVGLVRAPEPRRFAKCGACGTGTDSGQRGGGLEGRVRAIERQLVTVRCLLGSTLGAAAGAVAGDRFGLAIGLFVGCSIAWLGRLVPALLAGGVAGAMIGSVEFGGDFGANAGALVGALLAGSVTEVGRVRLD